MFGSEVKSQITLNLPTKSVSSKVAIYTGLVTPSAKYALMLRPIIDGVEDLIQSHCGKILWFFCKDNLGDQQCRCGLITTIFLVSNC